MKNVINIYHKKATKLIGSFKTFKNVSVDIKLENVHLLTINRLVRKTIFVRDSLYISSKTLFELMQPQGNKGSHNYHELIPEDIIEGLRGLQNPKAIIEGEKNRIVIITIYLSHFDLPLMFVIEKESQLIKEKNKSVNKLITIYPKDDIETYLEKRKVFYKK